MPQASNGFSGQDRQAQIDDAGTSDGFDIAGIAALLRRRIKLVIAFTMIGLLAGLAFLVLVAPKYQGSAVVLLDPRQINVLASPQVLPGIGGDAAAVESQVELISSNRLILKIIDDQGMMDDPELLGTPNVLKTFLNQVLSRPALTPETKQSKLVNQFRKNLAVSRRGLTYVMEINYKSKNADKAAKVANALATGYLDQLQEAKTGATSDAFDWLNERIKIMRGVVETSERAVVEYKRDNSIVDVGGRNTGDTVSRRQLEALNQELVRARAATAQAKARLDQIKTVASRSGDPGSSAAVLGSKLISDLRVDYAQLVRSESEIALTYGDRHPRHKAIRRQLVQMRAEINREIARFQQSVSNEHEIALSLQNSLEKELSQLENRAASANEVNVGLDDLKQVAAANRKIYTQLLSRAKQTSTEKSLKKSEARIVSPAMVPVKPTRLPAPLILALTAISGLIAGLGGATIAEAFDTRLRRRDTVEKTLNAACLGVLPVAKAKGGWLGGIGGMSANCRILRLSADEPDTPFAHAVRDIRQRIRNTGQKGQVVLVSSANDEEGKTTVAGNLAFSLANSGAFCLLIDLDLKQPALSKCLAKSSESGLLHILRGDATVEQVVIEDKPTGLFFVPSVDIKEGTGEADLLLTSKLPSFLEDCRKVFDCVILDGPAANQGQGAPFLFDATDTAIFVVEWNKTVTGDIASAMSVLGDVRNKISGVILNKADPSKTD